MIDFGYLLQDTSAYKTVKTDCINQTISHAYLITIPDEKFLKDYLKEFAKLIMCENGACGKCRACKLIDGQVHSDVMFFPKEDQTLSVSDINTIVEEAYYKPIEGERKVFVIYSAHLLNPQAQNKLLKTLEEPPKGVHIILGATNEFALLPTIKSRVKRLAISSFANDKIFKCLQETCTNNDKLQNAVRFGDGTLGKALSLYSDENFVSAMELAKDLIENMTSSTEVLKYSSKISELKIPLKEFLGILEIYFRDLLMRVNNKEQLIKSKNHSELPSDFGYKEGSILNAISKIEQANLRENSNMNQTMLIDWLLFGILEGKHKWRKL